MIVGDLFSELVLKNKVIPSGEIGRQFLQQAKEVAKKARSYRGLETGNDPAGNKQLKNK